MNIFNFDLIFLDYIILTITTIIVVFSLWKGFINSLLGLLTWVGSIFITIYTYDYLSSYINNLLLRIELLNNFDQFVSILSILISIPLIFLVSLLILKKIRKFLNSDLDKKLLGIILDKFFGVIYGLIFSYILFSSLLFLTNNNNFDYLSSINKYFLENSNVLKEISINNNNIIELYNTESNN